MEPVRKFQPQQQLQLPSFQPLPTQQQQPPQQPPALQLLPQLSSQPPPPSQLQPPQQPPLPTMDANVNVTNPPSNAPTLNQSRPDAPRDGTDPLIFNQSTNGNNMLVDKHDGPHKISPNVVNPIKFQRATNETPKSHDQKFPKKLFDDILPVTESENNFKFGLKRLDSEIDCASSTIIENQPKKRRMGEENSFGNKHKTPKPVAVEADAQSNLDRRIHRLKAIRKCNTSTALKNQRTKIGSKATKANYINQVTPYLQGVQEKPALYRFQQTPTEPLEFGKHPEKKSYATLQNEQFFDEDENEHVKETIEYCLTHPRWSLSLQSHKLLGLQ